MNFIDGILNRITMYRLVLYYLIALLAYAAVLSFFHILSYSPVDIAFSTVVLILSSLIANWLFAKVWGAVPGTASLFITALILALIVAPVSPTDVMGTVLLVLLGVWAMASKYLLAPYGKHLFNPAAFAVALSALIVSSGAVWWVAGNLWLAPVVVLGGLAIVRKIQRFDLVLSFFVTALATVALTSGSDPVHAVLVTLEHSALFFLGFVMLIEPATMPPTRSMRIMYGILVGIWFAPAMHIGSFYFTPELALLLGNIFVFFVSPKGRLMLRLAAQNEIAANTHEFVFTTNRTYPFTAGQYLEWTLPSGLITDDRGNRRYFTIASSPTENYLRLGVKFYDKSSAFKKKLLALRIGDTITAAGLGGDFTLPKDTKQKLVFIAGGIGITPFRAMIGSLLDQGEKRDAVLFYSNKTAEEVAYYDVLERARQELGLKTIYALTDDTRTFADTHTGMIDAELLVREVPDYRERTFYLSGPRGMVVAFQKALADLDVSPTRIKTDYFPGFA